MDPYSPTQPKVVKSRLASAEGLRGIAAILVFFGHFETIFEDLLAPGSLSNSIVDGLEIAGHRGVIFFLIISGYFTYGKFLDKPEPYGIFLKKRLARIYPLYFVVLGLYLVLSVLFPAESKIPQGTSEAVVYITKNILLLPGFMNPQPIITVSWTLGYLVLMYISVPLLVVGLKLSRWEAWQRVALIVTLAILWFGAHLAFHDFSVRPTTYFLGMLIYEAVKSRTHFVRLSRFGEFFAMAMMLMSLVLLFQLRYRMLGFLPGIEQFGRPMGLYWQSILFVGFFGFTVYAFKYDGLLKRFLNMSLLRFMGQISYSYYLFHGLTLKGIQFVLKMTMAPGYSSALFWSLLVIGFFTTLGTSSALYFFVERRLDSWFVPELTYDAVRSRKCA
jgi:peptidoglycan/LPS O-acetylase OafA/YrhL